ncbi:MAG: DUF3187 family protein [Acidobacteria bacterium]|nr:DUF3187 family protein [Acidobacteriota bacterium]
MACCERGTGVRFSAGLVLCVLLTGVPSASEAEVNRYLIDTGPLRIRDQFLLGMGFLGLDPVSADIVEPGKWQVDLIETVTNTWALSEVVESALEDRAERGPVTLAQFRTLESDQPDGGVFLVDGELYRTAVAVRRGVGKGVQLELVLPILSFQGGVFDSLVEDFHKAFGFSQVGRKGAPKDSLLLFSGSQKGEFFLDEDPGVGLGDVVLGAKFALLNPSEASRIRLALEALLKLPTGGDEPLLSSGGTDLGVQLLLTKYYTKSCLHASVGLLYLDESKQLRTDTQLLPTGMVAWERSLGPKMSGLAQLTVSQSPFRDLDLDELARATSQVTLGLKKVVWSKRVLFVGLTENISTFNSSPDIGFHVGLTTIF